MSYNPSSDRKPWEQLPGEPAYEYQLFEFYRDITNRTYKIICDQFLISRRTIIRYAKKWHWQRRVGLYDLYMNSSKSSYLRDDYECNLTKFEKFRQQYAVFNMSLASELFGFLDHYRHYRNDPTVTEKMKFIRETLRTINMVIKSAGYKISPIQRSEQIASDILLDDAVKATSPMDNNLFKKAITEINGIVSQLNDFQSPSEIQDNLSLNQFNNTESYDDDDFLDDDEDDEENKNTSNYDVTSDITSESPVTTPCVPSATSGRNIPESVQLSDEEIFFLQNLDKIGNDFIREKFSNFKIPSDINSDENKIKIIGNGDISENPSNFDSNNILNTAQKAILEAPLCHLPNDSDESISSKYQDSS